MRCWYERIDKHLQHRKVSTDFLECLYGSFYSYSFLSPFNHTFYILNFCFFTKKVAKLLFYWQDLKGAKPTGFLPNNADELKDCLRLQKNVCTPLDKPHLKGGNNAFLYPLQLLYTIANPHKGLSPHPHPYTWLSTNNFNNLFLSRTQPRPILCEPKFSKFYVVVAYTPSNKELRDLELHYFQVINHQQPEIFHKRHHYIYAPFYKSERSRRLSPSYHSERHPWCTDLWRGHWQHLKPPTPPHTRAPPLYWYLCPPGSGPAVYLTLEVGLAWQRCPSPPKLFLAIDIPAKTLPQVHEGGSVSSRVFSLCLDAWSIFWNGEVMVVWVYEANSYVEKN